MHTMGMMKATAGMTTATVGTTIVTVGMTGMTGRLRRHMPLGGPIIHRIQPRRLLEGLATTNLTVIQALLSRANINHTCPRITWATPLHHHLVHLRPPSLVR